MIEITKIGFDDLAALANLYEELSGEKTNITKMKEKFPQIDTNPDYMLVGAKNESNELLGSLVGILCHDMIRECEPFMLIENVIVKSNQRGLGIGKQLMTFIEEYARKNGCYYIIFVSSAHRKEAHKFYDSIGYTLDFHKGFKKIL